MINVFNYDNVVETLEKKPVVLYYCPPGACGPEGLFFVLFSDKSIYAYNVNLKNTDNALIKLVIEYIPELNSVISRNDNYQYRRKRYMDYYLIYLGLGNVGLVSEDFYEKRNAVDGQYSYPDFLNQVKEYSSTDISKMYDEVKKVING